jgi:hypothetical protein
MPQRPARPTKPVNCTNRITQSNEFNLNSSAINDQFMQCSPKGRHAMNWHLKLTAAMMARRPGPKAKLRLKGRPCNAIPDKVNSPIPDATCMQEFKSSIATGELTKATGRHDSTAPAHARLKPEHTNH